MIKGAGSLIIVRISCYFTQNKVLSTSILHSMSNRRGKILPTSCIHLLIIVFIVTLVIFVVIFVTGTTFDCFGFNRRRRHCRIRRHFHIRGMTGEYFGTAFAAAGNHQGRRIASCPEPRISRILVHRRKWFVRVTGARGLVHRMVVFHLLIVARVRLVHFQ